MFPLLGISSIECLLILMLNNFSLTWSPPSFYSNDIPQGTITTYHVYIKSEDGSVLVNINTTDTFYNNKFSNNFTVCDIYHFIILLIVRPEVHYNNKYDTCIIYHYYNVTLYFSYEDPVLLTIPTTDPYHISHHEVCVLIYAMIFS